MFVAHCGLSLVTESRGYFLAVVCRLLTAVVSWCGAWALGPWAQLFLGMWDLPDPGIKSLLPALSGILYH